MISKLYVAKLAFKSIAIFIHCHTNDKNRYILICV